MSTYRIGIALFFVAVLAICSASPAAAETLTLDACMQRAVEYNQNLKAAGYEVDQKAAERKSVRGRFGPVVMADASLLFWDDPFAMEFDLAPLLSAFDGLAPLLPAETKAQLAEMAANPMEIVAREDRTLMAKVTVAQPLTQLYQVYSGHWAAGELEKAAKQSQVKVRRDLELDVAKMYYNLTTALQLTETARAGLKQVEAYETQVQAYLDAELVERNALLKVRVQKAEIQKVLFQAEKGSKLARAALNMYMARPLDAPLEPVMDDDDGTPERLLADRLGEQQKRAVEDRPAIVAARHQQQAARAARHAAIGAMLPELNLVGMYEYADGLPGVQPENMFYGGLVLNWHVWEWGATWYKLRAAEAQQNVAGAKINAAEDGIRLDVESKRLELEEALQSQRVAEVALTQAEENLRVEQLRYEVQETTTTDLLQAQTLKLKAENDAIVAELKVKQAAYALRRAMGEELLSSDSGA